MNIKNNMYYLNVNNEEELTTLRIVVAYMSISSSKLNKYRIAKKIIKDNDLIKIEDIERFNKIIEYYNNNKYNCKKLKEAIKELILNLACLYMYCDNEEEKLFKDLKLRIKALNYILKNQGGAYMVKKDKCKDMITIENVNTQEIYITWQNIQQVLQDFEITQEQFNDHIKNGKLIHDNLKITLY